MNDPRCKLLPGREKSLLRRHPWVFSGALAEPDADIAPGETVTLCDSKGTPLARAAWSPESQLRARVWSFDPDTAIDAEFFRARIARAVRASGKPVSTSSAAMRRDSGVVPLKQKFPVSVLMAQYRY